MPAGGLPASGTSARARGQLGEDGGRQRAADPVGQRDGAGGEHHAVVEQRLDQALPQQVGLPGGRRPAAGPVDQVEVVEGVQRVRASRGVHGASEAT